MPEWPRPLGLLTRASAWTRALSLRAPWVVLLSIERASLPRIALSGGDPAVLARGHGHALRDHPKSPVTLIHEPAAGEEPVHLEIGGAGPETVVLSGGFDFEDLVETPVLSTLPPMIRITPDVDQAVPSFEQNLRFIAREVDSKRPGAQIVLTRMADVILVQILRAYIESLPDGSEGFLGALRDANVGAALGLMHREPGDAWTVASLADKVGLSRSVFAARFAQLVGETPLGYLTRVRMQKAAALLREGATLAVVSQKTGYSSEASFSHAFRQWSGVAPGRYRRAQRAADPQPD
jgi:AraC-like DNA-binding protein